MNRNEPLVVRRRGAALMVIQVDEVTNGRTLRVGSAAEAGERAAAGTESNGGWRVMPQFTLI